MQMIADGKINKNQDLKIIFNDNSVESFKFDGDDILDGTYRNIFNIYGTKVILKQDFEILEDKTEEIEELEVYVNYKEYQNLVTMAKKINKLNKQDTSKETNCMSE